MHIVFFIFLVETRNDMRDITAELLYLLLCDNPDFWKYIPFTYH